jgi:hypothetical protein
MNLLSLVGPRLDNICQIRRKWYYSSGSKKIYNLNVAKVSIILALVLATGQEKKHLSSLIVRRIFKCSEKKKLRTRLLLWPMLKIGLSYLDLV